ncbi:hypothetical protein [Allorhodopirellula solitaria]|uniref:Uncharacterized protein n=1 Tax=Allorhodopirellula solitaria TaxID=2527987 RepID=A0A5C5XTD7_9BACT|nr:hypothetical protein [Allorhodopirellula solitaria]TWT66517.1 hypothetical protein CA85_26140 [Allorhodopirellula solitaria]
MSYPLQCECHWAGNPPSASMRQAVLLGVWRVAQRLLPRQTMLIKAENCSLLDQLDQMLGLRVPQRPL